MMQNFYWKSAEFTRNLIEEPFPNEAELEKYIFANQDLLGDVIVIYRQIKTGQKQGIPDMLGVDQDANICIIELKNQPAGEDILPQALGYAIWAETNPDSIKAIWLESKDRPEDIEIDWDNFDIRVILIAPSFKTTVPRMAGKIGYPIDLVQVRRYRFEDNEFLLVEEIEEEEKPRITTTKGITIWDWDYYESEHGKEATQQFKQAVESIASLVEKHEWNLPYNINKYYTGFKLGNKVVFNVAWGGTYVWKIKFKLPKEDVEGFKGKQWEFQNYEESFKEAVFKPVNPEAANINEIEQFFVEAYKRMSGLSG
jgi:hypothetical protein